MMDEWEVNPRFAAITTLQAQVQGITALKKSREQLHEEATHMITRARDATQLFMNEWLISLMSGTDEIGIPFPLPDIKKT